MNSKATTQLATRRFTARKSVEQVEEGNELAPKFDAHGLITCITTDAASGEVLMLDYMNAEALACSIETGKAHYWSRSRQQLWHKGATSGLIQKIVELRVIARLSGERKGALQGSLGNMTRYLRGL